MAVGNRFMDPDTQAAIAAQSGQPADTNDSDTPQPQENVKEQEPAQQEPATSEPSGEHSQKQDKSDDVDLNMDNQPEPEDVDTTLKKAGFDPEAIGKEFGENDGKLTSETEKALRDKFGDTAVDNHLKDMADEWATTKPERDKAVAEAKANVDQMNTYIYETLANGDADKGKENLQTLSKWCQDNMPKDELAAINTLLRSGDKTVVRQGLTQAVSAWRKGTEKPMMSGDALPTNQEKAAQKLEPLSKDQYIKIVGTEKYNTDSEYAAKIDQRRRATMATESYITPEFSASRPPIR
jgi:hypothetical protein